MGNSKQHVFAPLKQYGRMAWLNGRRNIYMDFEQRVKIFITPSGPCS